MTFLTRSIALAALLSKTVLVSAHPQGNILATQPNNGGGNADNCGNGPIGLNADSWNQRNMDSVIESFWNEHSANPNFDFHQQFADQYGIDLYCPDSFQICQSDPSSCSALIGSNEDKEHGWLGIKAMMSVQDMFIQYEKAFGMTVDYMRGYAVEFQEKFNPPQNDGFVWDFFQAIITTAISIISIPYPVAGVALGGVNTFANLAVETIRGDDGEIDETAVMNTITSMQREALNRVEAVHNATFSNGIAGDVHAATMKDMLKSGVFSGKTSAQAYEGGESSLQEFVDRYMAFKLLEGTWTAQNAFFIYIPGVTGDCGKWKKNTGDHQKLRYCGSEGMTLLHSVDGEDDHPYFSEPGGVSDENVKWIGGYEIDLQSIYESNYNMYKGHGLTGPKDPNFHFMNLYNAWTGGNRDIAKMPGFFSLPVCELKAWNWGQSDDAHNNAPCDCLCATDAWGNKFADSVSEKVKKWLQSNTECPPC